MTYNKSKNKGTRAESAAKEILHKYTGLNWQRTPLSGALDAKHGLKSDLYIPDAKNNYCVEVKHYKDEHFNTSLFTGKNPQLIDWWEQAVRQGQQVGRKPLLLFKHDRSKWFAAFQDMPGYNYRFVFVNFEPHEFYVATLDDYLQFEQPKFVS